jgi:ribonucleoside-diphosphate reductase alpha chain
MKTRPESLEGKTLKAKTDCGSFFLTLNKLDGELFEVRAELGKGGNCVKNLLHLVAVLYSVLLQSDIEKKELTKIIRKHCEGVSCGNAFPIEGVVYKSCVDWMAQQLLKELKDEKAEAKTTAKKE